ncbi:type I restriction endonuclease subunit R [Membranihabitans maritimus]|uniref:type I restriction endonuclease subunit R n=1 Tax=Membranihabitans maritimus TaxID=2904244 RepID=UPI001F372880|nr:type I restriction endonuclease [Membranihabitans maritimus]
MPFNEDSRVKIPAILHLIRLGYKYLSLKSAKWDKETNIFRGIFRESVQNINPDYSSDEILTLYKKVSLALKNEDLGQEFYEMLMEQSEIRLIDFHDFSNNTFHVVTELPYEKDDESFRPDIICLINGMPLVFIEVKKPNNRDGVLAERKRINERFRNRKFRHFINITQLMIFSNNMEYEEGVIEPIVGAYYASPSYGEPIFNYFREEEDFNLSRILMPLTEEEENSVLQYTNLVSIKNSHAFTINKDPHRPTNRICTSLLQKDRLHFILQYAIAYVKRENGLQKHIMRYPQLFATKAIAKKLDQGLRKGIIWHTQGSGKTALAFYNVKHLTNYYREKGVIPKFYFIVDRLDLLIQASNEFRIRGLVVHNIDSREDFAKDIKSTTAIHNDSGKAEITVVNIQKFKDDPDVTRNTDYNVDIKRIYFLDEVHRSYNPKGSFLANLKESDPSAIKIGLTGTPLLGNDYNSRDLFGDYIHKYYYNRSIADGYTLRLIREEIETSYKMQLQETLNKISILKGSSNRRKVFSKPNFVEPMLDYIIDNFEQARLTFDDDTIGGMVICDSSDQAKQMYEIFQEKYATGEQKYLMAAEDPVSYKRRREARRKVKSAALILHDIGTKQDRKDWVDDFKKGDYDFLFVYNMLLTGFDAPRLKKLYIGRIIKSHNLLQALTRVNRTYRDHRYGYVVDFADIEKEFDKTNRAYFDELQSELGDEMENYSDLFKSGEEIEREIEEIKDVLFHFDTINPAVFSGQISEVNDRKEMLRITKSLDNARDLYNIIRLTGQYKLLEKLDFRALSTLSRMAHDRLALINQKESIEQNLENTNLLNLALEEVIFAFTKVGEEEMVLADQLKDMLRKTREGMGANFDSKDPQFISLREELERLFKKKNLNNVSKEEMECNMEELKVIYNQANELNRQNNLLRAKYDQDEKYTRLHKRLMEKDPLTDNERKLYEALNDLKKVMDIEILDNSKVMENENYMKRLIDRNVIQVLKDHHFPVRLETVDRINHLLVNEYINEYNGIGA